MRKIKDIKLYLVSRDKDLCFYWEKYFGDSATVVNDTLYHFYSVNKDCEGFTFTGTALGGLIYMPEFPLQVPQDLPDKYRSWLFYNEEMLSKLEKIIRDTEETDNRLDEIIKSKYHGYMTRAECIYTDIKGRFTDRNKQVFAFYTPEQVENYKNDSSYVEEDTIFQCMFNTLFKASEAGVASIATEGWGAEYAYWFEYTHAKIIAYTMKRAYDLALRIEADPDFRDKAPYYEVPGPDEFEIYTEFENMENVAYPSTFCWEIRESEDPEFTLREHLEKELLEKHEYVRSHHRVLILHGVDGNADNAAYRELLKIFPEECIEAPQIDYEATEPYEIIRDHLEKNYDLIVGIGFGGFYAFVIGEMLGIPAVVMNPCVPPEKYIPGLFPDYAYTEQLKETWDCFRAKEKRWKRVEYAYKKKIWRYKLAECIAILSTEDELLDTKLIEEVFPAMRIEKFAKGHHMNDEESMQMFSRCVKYFLYKRYPFEDIRD